MTRHNPKRVFVLTYVLAITLFVGACPPKQQVQEDTDSLNSTMLDIAALAFKDKNVEEAGVLFLKSKIRFHIDRIVYPPVLKGAMARLAGGAISRRLSEDPKTFLKVVERVGSWNPKFPQAYDPGWKFKHKIKDEEVQEAVTHVREKMLSALRKSATLLADERYQIALKELTAIRNDPNYSARQYEEFEQRRILFEIEWQLIPESRWHNRVSWKAGDFFKNARVIELCQAIEADDLGRMKTLIDAGVDVNAKGKFNMTPLLWAYSDYKLERFRMLLKAGANPNVVATSTFGIENQKFHPNLTHRRYRDEFYEKFNVGSSVNMMAYQAFDNRFALAVLKHGGDVNQIEPATRRSPLSFVMVQYRGDQDMMIKALVSKGADKNLALQWSLSRRWDKLATFLLEAGADPNANGSLSARILLKREVKIPDYKPGSLLEYQQLKTLMAKHGADFEAARRELDRGPAWGLDLRRQRKLKALVQRLIYEQKYPAKKASDEVNSKIAHFLPLSSRGSLDCSYIDRSWRSEWSEKYSKYINDLPGGALSLKYVSKDALKDVDTSLPDFATLGKTVVFNPTFSGNSEWLYTEGDVMVDYLKYLVGIKCNLMNRSTSDFPSLPDDSVGYYFFEIDDSTRHHELLIPAQYLLDEKLRKEFGLEPFGGILEVLEKLKQWAMVGDVEQTERLISEVNKRFKVTFPDVVKKQASWPGVKKLPFFYIHHLTSASRDGSGKLHCKLEFSEPIDNTTRRVYSADCVRDGDELTIEISRRSEKTEHKTKHPLTNPFLPTSSLPDEG